MSALAIYHSPRIETTDARDRPRTWIVVEPGDADEPVPGSEVENNLRERRRQSHHPAHLGGRWRTEVLPRAGGKEQEEREDHFQLAAAMVFVPRLETIAWVSSSGRML